ncbi:hypothetical protein CDD83_11116 [Cordyceps sp. RAO-2017]|nr:hypothetical protein CDD83_11116 [Cordyceps sp. RAO-2017]
MEYDAKEVAQHKNADSTWLIIHGQVYDVSEYLMDHPGGADVLAEAAGSDASEAFENAGHSEDVLDIMKAYHVGKLKGFKEKPKNVPVGVNLLRKRMTPTVEEQSMFKMANLGVCATAIAAIYFLGPHYSAFIPSSSISPIHDMWPKPHGRGFVNGLLIGAGLFATFDAVLAYRILGMFRIKTKTFASYPAHIKMTRMIQTDELLQRGWLDPVNYKKLPLTAKSLLAPNVYRLTFELPSTKTVLGLPVGQHVAIRAQVAGETITRSYTPVSNNADRGVLDLVIKMYSDGRLTNGYLANLQIGDEVEFRGPKGAMKYRRGLCKTIGMVAGGTGITPMFQLIRAICEHDRDLTEISLIYANRTEQDILMRSELDAYARQYPRNFKVYYVLDSPSDDWKYGKGYVTKELLKERLPAPSLDSKVMLCGPLGMVNASKKSLVELGFAQPGASAKLADQIFLF